MATNIYPEELTALVEEYMADGIISDKERKVLLNKAQSLGVNADEFDLYIDAQQQKTDQQVDAASKKKRAAVCPFCGGPIPLLTDKCPHCDHFITAEANEELQEIIDSLESALVDFKSGTDVSRSKASVERYVRKAKIYYENNPKVKKLLEEVEAESVLAEKKAKKKARKEAVKNVLKYNKKLTTWMAIIILVLLFWGGCSVVSWIKGPDIAEDPQACIEAVNNAIAEGNIDQAVTYCEAYFKENSGYLYRAEEEIAPATNAIIIAYANGNNYDRAISMMNSSTDSSIRLSVMSKCIEAGEYDLAEASVPAGHSHYYNYLCKCIDHMNAHGRSNDIQGFIDRKITYYDDSYSHVLGEEWSQKNIRKRLLEYAGIK